MRRCSRICPEGIDASDGSSRSLIVFVVNGLGKRMRPEAFTKHPGSLGHDVRPVWNDPVDLWHPEASELPFVCGAGPLRVRHLRQRGFGCSGLLGSFRIAPRQGRLRPPRAGIENDDLGTNGLPEVVEQRNVRDWTCRRNRPCARSKSATIGEIGFNPR